MLKKIRGSLVTGLFACAVLTGCGTAALSSSDVQVAQSTAHASSSTTGASGAVSNVASVLAENSTPDMVNISDSTTSTSAVAITLNGDAIAAEGAGVAVDGSTATITAAGSYNISGSLNDGQIVVDTDDTDPVQLIFNGVNINNSTSAPIYIKHAESAEVVLAEGTDNTLTDGATYLFASADEDEPNAALFSDDDLTISGSGSLTVNANYNDGIASKDGLVIVSGTINVSAADDGIRGKNELIVNDGAITVNAGGDGLKADNAEDATLGYISIEKGVFTITAGGDGMQAETDLAIADGDFTIMAGGGSTTAISDDLSAKGLKATANLVIDGGSFAINAADDGVHSNGDVVINNGAFSITTGDDGIHTDTNVTVNGGDIQVVESVEGLEGANIVLNNGTVSLTTSDDGINAAGGTGEGGMGWSGQGGGNYSLAINGGTLIVDAAGDGLDSNGSVTMSGGLVVVNGPTERMNGALDYDGSFTISGGLLVAAGSSGMAEAPGETSSQHSLLLNITSTQEAGNLIHIQNSAGEELLTFAPTKAYQSITFSSPELVAGESYQVYLGGSATGTESSGLYQDATYTPGNEYASFTISDIVTRLGNSSRGRP